MARRSGSPEEMSLGGRLASGGLTAALGLMVVVMAFGVIPVDPQSVHAPRWVIVTIGGMFALVGLWILTAGTPVGTALKHVVGPVVLLGMLSVLHWVAFGPGVRQCTGSFLVPFFSEERPVGDLECRIAFGYGALLFDGLIFGAMLSTWAESNLEGFGLRVAKGVGNTLIVVPLAPLIAVLLLGTLAKAAWMKVRGR